MSEPIAFVSRFRVKPGSEAKLRELARLTTSQIEMEKPGTLLFLVYLDADRSMVSFLHAFADADSMDRHFEGSDERSRAAYDLIEPAGWEFFGTPSPEALEAMQRAAAASGATLTVRPDHVAGFLRLTADAR